jgi:hypothetical protein
VTPLNACALCQQDFGSLELFDAHMTGRPFDRGRGCLSVEQMRERGWALNDRGRWHDPEETRAVRERFRRREAFLASGVASRGPRNASVGQLPTADRTSPSPQRPRMRRRA